MAFGCSSLGSIYHVVLTVLGATTGPVVGLFFLGIFVPRANKIGAFFGLTVSTLLMVCLSIVANYEHPYSHYIITQTFANSSAGCVNYEPAEMAMREQMK
jgi:Na+/proline symporter